MEPTVLLYDGDCGLCRWSAATLLRWDRRERIRAIALQDPEADRLLAGMDPDERMASWHLVGPSGLVRSAGAAVGPLLRLLPGGRPLAVLAKTFPRSTDRAYRFVAGHRGRFGALAGQQRCSIDPSLTRRH